MSADNLFNYRPIDIFCLILAPIQSIRRIIIGAYANNFGLPTKRGLTFSSSLATPLF